MSFVTVEQVKLHIGLPLTNQSENGRIQQFLDGVEEAVWQWTGRARVEGYGPFESVQSTEYYSGGDRQKLVLLRRPVTAVAGVWVDMSGHYGANPGGFADPATLWEYGTTYAPQRLDQTEGNPGILVAYRGNVPSFHGQAQRSPAWPRGEGNIKVTYTAGYTNLPVDIATAVCNIVASVRAAAPRGMPMDSETIGRYSYTLLKPGTKGGGSSEFDEIGMALATLARYKEVNL